MGIVFNADEIFEIAEQIERNGARFYRQAAGIAFMSDISPLLLDLALMEERHEQIFSDMRKTLSSQERAETVFDPDNEATSYLQSFADGHVFNVQDDPCKCLTKKKEDIIRLAIEKEKDSIVFYLGMKEVVSEDLGKGRIDDVIREEMSHITQLNKEWNKM
jgi:rubrerythrin